MEDIIKVTRSLITSIFKKVKTALNDKADKKDLDNKANKNDVVLVEQIGEPNWVAPLDLACKVPRENISENGWGILEVRDFDSEVDAEPSSTTEWDYILFDFAINNFLAHNPNDGKFYNNWSNSSDYRDNATNEIRQNRLFVNTQDDYFMKWDGQKFVEVCMPLGTTLGTAYSGADGNALKNTVTSHDAAILASTFENKTVNISTNVTIPLWLCQYDVVYVSSSKSYYFYYNGTLQKLSTSSVTPGQGILRNPIQIPSTSLKYTPFKDVEGMINYVCKGEVVGEYRQWFIIMKQDTEDQTYYAGTSSNSNYYNQSYICYYNKYNKPWELWLPTTVTRQSVYIDY